MWIINKLWKIKSWYRLIWKHKSKIDIGLSLKIPLSAKIKYNMLGFTDEDYYVYDLKNNDYHKYISYKERWRLENLNGRFSDFLSEKVVFERLFRNYVNVPPIFCWERNGRLIDLESGEAVSIKALLRREHKIIAKPTRSIGGGSGVHLMQFNGKELCVDGEKKSEEQIEAEVRQWKEYIFVKCIEPAHYSEVLFPGVVNSIRIVSVLNQQGDVEFLFAAHRIVSEKSKPVDNLSSGGLFSLIDLDTGKLGPAKTILLPTVEYSKHPDTGADIEGVIVPNWRNTLNTLKKVHKCFAYFRFLAWDVVLDNNDEMWILEINRGTDLEFQAIAPMRNGKMGKFMRNNKLLDRF